MSIPSPSVPANHGEIPISEISIPTPTGHIAARVWGDLGRGQPILLVHGWLDNAASFDLLAPMIIPPDGGPLVAIDLPGHGLSSHLPQGSMYHIWEMSTSIQRVFNYFKWSSVRAIGHSMGGMILLIFTSLFPERIDKLVVLDGMVNMRPIMVHRDRARRSILEMLALEDKIARRGGIKPVYSLEEAKKRLQDNRDLTEEATMALMSRALEAGPLEREGFAFRHDPHFNLTQLYSFDFEFYMNVFCHLRSELMFVRITESDMRVFNHQLIPLLNVLKNACSRFEFVTVDGNHDVHMNHPERVAPIIRSFLGLENVCHL